MSISTLDSPITKTCRVCSENKEVDNFYKNYTIKDGYMNICKFCFTKEATEKREKRKIESKDLCDAVSLIRNLVKGHLVDNEGKEMAKQFLTRFKQKEDESI